jgi:hypothetical protein
MSKNYSCIRCNYETDKLYLIKNHLNKEKKCDRITMESFKYTDEEIYELSTIMISKRNNLKCEFCKKTYSNKKTLNSHQKNNCKNADINNTNTINNPAHNITNQSNNTSNNNTSNSNNINNSFNTTNIHDNSTNIININIPISFDKDWSVEHFDNCMKLVLLSTTSKYTEFLENILNNKINLNVIINKENNDAIVFSGDKYENMEKNKVFSKSMEKIHEQLTKLKENIHKDDLYKQFIYDSDKNIEIADKKYKDYIENDSIKKTVHDYLSNIYDSRKKEALEIYEEYNKNKKVNDDKGGF